MATDQAAFAVGEEVVFRLDGVAAREIGGGRPLPGEAAPSWWIGVVSGRGPAGRYVLRFRYQGREYECGVTEDLIEGTA